MMNILQKLLKRTSSELTVKLLTGETAALSILSFLIMDRGFILAQFALKSCHLLAYQSNDQPSWISPCETTNENVLYNTRPLSSEKSTK